MEQSRNALGLGAGAGRGPVASHAGRRCTLRGTARWAPPSLVVHPRRLLLRLIVPQVRHLAVHQDARLQGGGRAGGGREARVWRRCGATGEAARHGACCRQVRQGCLAQHECSIYTARGGCSSPTMPAHWPHLPLVFPVGGAHAHEAAGALPAGEAPTRSLQRGREQERRGEGKGGRPCGLAMALKVVPQSGCNLMLASGGMTASRRRAPQEPPNTPRSPPPRHHPTPPPSAPA